MKLTLLFVCLIATPLVFGIVVGKPRSEAVKYCTCKQVYDLRK